jgi:hypothetical protein
MDIKQPIDYLQFFQELLSRRGELTQQRDQIEVEIVKVTQLIGVIYPLLPRQKQKSYEETMEAIKADSGGLQEGIKLVFSLHKGEPLTPTNVRDHLQLMGFDFRHYEANPLSSITTTLKRMVPKYLETAETSSGTIYVRRDTLEETNKTAKKEE